jgi:uncharacterized protein
LIFIDTGGFLARYLKKDQYYSEAIPVWKRLVASNERLFTSNLVMDETITLIARRAGYRFAEQKVHSLYASPTLEILRSDHQMESTALDLFREYADQEVSFTDCVSFVLMRAHRLTRVFCFDRHFDIPGFFRIPLIPLS